MSLFLACTRNRNIAWGCAEKFEFLEGKGGIFCGLILENSEGRGGHMKNPFRGWGMDIFWNHTLGILSFSCVVSFIDFSVKTVSPKQR